MSKLHHITQKNKFPQLNLAGVDHAQIGILPNKFLKACPIVLKMLLEILMLKYLSMLNWQILSRLKNENLQCV